MHKNFKDEGQQKDKRSYLDLIRGNQKNSCPKR